jgi:hypothetical protein
MLFLMVNSLALKLLRSKINLYVLVIMGFFSLSSFMPAWKLLAEIKVQVKDMETDHLGNVYAVNSSNQLYKYDANGKLLSTLNYAYIGNITHLDCSNPLEIYLFYKELNAVVFLDNNLAYRGRMNLSDFGIVQAGAIARTFDNGVWVFDIGDLQLKKMDRDGTLAQQSGNALQFSSGSNLAPDYMVDNGKRVFVNDSANGILVFDVFANYLKTIPVKGQKDFMVTQEHLYYEAPGALVRYQLNTLQRDTLLLPEPNSLQTRLVKEKLYLAQTNEMRIYSFQ